MLLEPLTAVSSVDGRYLRVNRKFCAMLGYSEAELLGRPAADFSRSGDRENDASKKWTRTERRRSLFLTHRKILEVSVETQANYVFMEASGQLTAEFRLAEIDIKVFQLC